jgi:hypothetical protein
VWVCPNFTPPTAASAISIVVATRNARLITHAPHRVHRTRSLRLSLVRRVRASYSLPRPSVYPKRVNFRVKPSAGGRRLRAFRGLDELFEGDEPLVERPSHHHADHTVDLGQRQDVCHPPHAPAGDGRHEAGDSGCLLQRNPA